MVSMWSELPRSVSSMIYWTSRCCAVVQQVNNVSDAILRDYIFDFLLFQMQKNKIKKFKKK